MVVKKNTEEILDYLSDASNFKGNCDTVYLPESNKDFTEILTEAHRNKTRITISGKRTGLTGSAIPEDGSIISLEKMNRIIEINKSEKYAIVEPGVLLSALQNEVKRENLFYPPDPTETNCSMGGNISTNASGAGTFKYGSTRDYVLELEIILASGELLNIKRNEIFANDYSMVLPSTDELKIEIPRLKMPLVKNAAGYFCKKSMDAIDLFIGSEGTLGIISKAKLRLLEQPEKLISCVAFFDDESNGLEFIKTAREQSYLNKEKIKEHGINARALEFFDKNALYFLTEDFPQVFSAGCAVWFAQEVNSKNEEVIMEEWLKLIVGNNGSDEKIWMAIDVKDHERIKEFRHAISYKVNEYIAGNNFRKLGTDSAVPHNDFKNYYYFSKELVEDSKLDYVIYGHFGDSHIHLNMLPKNDLEFNTGKNIYKTLCQEAVRLGGTVSAEHGIGKTKREYLKFMYNESEINQMFKLKKQLDPALILSPGNIFT